MTIVRNIYSAVISDAIGNEPIVDQFDIEYGAAFYGTMNDDYVTGSMIVSTDNNSYVTGTRGNYFSQTYASTAVSQLDSWNSVFSTNVPPEGWYQNPLTPTYFPTLSTIAQPLIEKSKNSFRAIHCYDDKERYYDSCLPDLGKALANDGTKIKNVNTSLSWRGHNLRLLNTAASQSLMQTKNFPALDLNYVTFNVTKFIGDLSDPSVNNEWTWAYPYESKFFPTKRYLKLNNVLGVGNAKSATLPAIPVGASPFFPNVDTEIPNSFPLDLPLVTYASAIYGSGSLLTALAKEAVSGLIPVLPGKFPHDKLPSYARNGNRTYYPYQSESYWCSTASDDDDDIGFSFLVPCDVDGSVWMKHLEAQIVYSSRTENDKARPKFESMKKEDLAKFFFGFGDINTMTYFSHSLGRASYSYETIFNGITPLKVPPATCPIDDLFYDVPDNVTLKSYTESGDWYRAVKNGENSTYFIFEDPFPPGPSTSRISWPRNDQVFPGPGLAFINNCLITGSVAMPDSIFMYFDVNSNYTWKYQYTRAVISSDANNFMSSSVVRVNVNGYNDTIDITNSATTSPMTQLTLAAQAARGYQDPADKVIGGSNQKTINSLDEFTSIKFPPGHYKIILCCDLSHANASPDFAAITNFNLITYPDYTTNKNFIMGGNNYPDFQIKRVEGTSYPDNPNYDDPYPDYDRQRLSTIFGVSPIIRGWKYGLHSGLPTHTRAAFRRNRFGQPRDMLEQRQYTKFIISTNEMFDGEATPGSYPQPDPTTKESPVQGLLGAPPVTVGFVKQSYVKDDRNIGKISSHAVTPESTVSHNLSTEVTSSLPFFDGEARDRPESSYAANTSLKLSTISFTGTTTSFTII